MPIDLPKYSDSWRGKEISSRQCVTPQATGTDTRTGEITQSIDVHELIRVLCAKNPIDDMTFPDEAACEWKVDKMAVSAAFIEWYRENESEIFKAKYDRMKRELTEMARDVRKKPTKRDSDVKREGRQEQMRSSKSGKEVIREAMSCSTSRLIRAH
jgi:hypothetical protein